MRCPGCQYENREGAWADDPPVAPGAGRRDNKMMDRRTFLCGLALSPLASPSVAGAQQQAGKTRLIGYLCPTVRNTEESGWLRGFWDAMSKLGYSENTSWTLEQRYADDRLDRLPS